MNFMAEMNTLNPITESETMRFVMHEFDDTINVLKDACSDSNEKEEWRKICLPHVVGE